MNIKDLIKITDKYSYHLAMISSSERDLINWTNWSQDCKAVLDAKKSIEIYKKLNKELEAKFNGLNIDFERWQSEQLPDENLYQPCEGCTTSCKSWEVFFCKKLVGT
jgi:hypothetical protein